MTPAPVVKNHQSFVSMLEDVLRQDYRMSSSCSLFQDEENVVTCLDEQRHGFESGDYVTFKEVQVSCMLGVRGICEK